MDSSENNARLRSSPIDRASKPDSLGPRASDDNTELDILPRAANQTLQTHWFSLLARRVEKHKFGGGAIDGQGPRGYGHSSRLAVPWGQTGDAPISMARSDLDTRARKIHRPARISNNSRGMIVPTTCEGLWRPAGAWSTAGARQSNRWAALPDDSIGLTGVARMPRARPAIWRPSLKL